MDETSLDKLDAIAEEIKAALAADAGETFTNAELHEMAWHMIIADDPDPYGYLEERRRRFEDIAKSAASFLAAVEALRPEEAEELLIDHRLQGTLRSAQSWAELVAARKPPRPRGRKSKLNAVRVAAAVLDAFEMVTDKSATITVDPVTSSAGGAYLELVAMVFRVLGIRANAEHYAKTAIAKSRSDQSDA